jgi:hypothetical protein
MTRVFNGRTLFYSPTHDQNCAQVILQRRGSDHFDDASFRDEPKKPGWVAALAFRSVSTSVNNSSRGIYVIQMNRRGLCIACMTMGTNSMSKIHDVMFDALLDQTVFRFYRPP